MNNKLLLCSIPILALALVTAGVLNHYGFFQQDIEVNSPIIVSSLGSAVINDVWAGEGGIREGEPVTIENIADFPVEVSISNDNEASNIDVSYVGTLELTKKTVDFSLDVWEVLDDKVQIEYTVVGKEFQATTELILDEFDSPYVLIYYADAVDRFVNPEKAIFDVVGNLPSEDDANADFYDYSEEYPTTPHGAKIWYVPRSAINTDDTLDWSRADEFYFESSLIQFNMAGLITVYPGEVLDFTPVYTIAPSYFGSTTITTFVDPITQ